MTDRLPKLPEGLFFRISQGGFFGPTVHVEVRRERRLLGLRWSTRVDVTWGTAEWIGRENSAEVALLLTEILAERQWAKVRDVRGELGDLLGDHR